MKEISLFGDDCIKRLEIESLGFDEPSDFDKGIICALIKHKTKNSFKNTTIAQSG